MVEKRKRGDPPTHPPTHQVQHLIRIPASSTSTRPPTHPPTYLPLCATTNLSRVSPSLEVIQSASTIVEERAEIMRVMASRRLGRSVQERVIELLASSGLSQSLG